MIKLTNYALKISNHALERAKQRLIIENIDNTNIVYEFKLLELIKQKAVYFYEDKNKFVYKMVYNNSTYKIIINYLNNSTLLIETIIKI